MDYLRAILAMAVPQAPLYVLDLVGLVIAITRKGRHPKVSLWAGIYFGSKLILSLIGLGTGILPLILSNAGYRMTNIGMIMTVISLIFVAINTILSIILLYSVFGWRGEEKLDTVPLKVDQSAA